MFNKKLFFCLPPEWQEQMAAQIGGEVYDDRIIRISEEKGNGQVFFIQVIPGLAVLLMDFTLYKPTKIVRFNEDYERYIFHFDISHGCNSLKINNMDFVVGSPSNLSIGVFSNQSHSSFETSVGERTFALRLYVDKKLMEDFIENNPDNEYEKLKKVFSKKSWFFFDIIDSKSLLLLLALKEKSFFDLSFEPYIKGISLNLLGFFLDRYSISNSIKGSEIEDFQNQGIEKAKNYLLNNLYKKFPSILFLAKMAGMSSTKFKLLFKKRFQNSPNKIFIKEKMNLAKLLLQSGDFNSMTEIIYELDYKKLDYFSAKYYEVFKRKPYEDFNKKE